MQCLCELLERPWPPGEMHCVVVMAWEVVWLEL